MKLLDWSPGEFGLWRALQKLIQDGEAVLEEYAYYSPHVHLQAIQQTNLFLGRDLR